MTNNDEMALKPVGNLFTSDKGEVLFSPSKWPISGFEFAGCVYSAEQVNTLLAERDADKKQLAAMSQTFMNLKLLADVYLHAYEEAKASVAELEARTVSVKLPPKVDSSNLPFAAHSWNSCIDEVAKRLAAAGINLEVGE